MIGGIEPGVEGVEHRPRHRHAIVAFQHRRRIGEHHRNRVALFDAGLGQCRGQPPARGIELGIGRALPAMDDGGVIGIDRGRPGQESEGRQRLVVGGRFRRSMS